MFGALSAGINATSSLVNNLFQAKNAAAQRQFEAQENEKTRDYNRQLAQQQNTWNIEQWERENAYNTPLQQMRRYNDAGLNPDLIYGQQNLSASSPQLTSGAPATPTPADSFDKLPTWGNVGQSALAGLESAARIRNINADTANKEADTNKKDEETTGLSIDNIYKALHHEQDLEVGKTVIGLNIANKNFTEKDTERLQTEISKLGEEIDNLRQVRQESVVKVDVYRQQIESMKNDDKLKMLDFFLKENEVQAQIRLLSAQANITEKEASVFMERHINEMFNLRADTNVKHSQLDINNENYRTMKKYGDDLMAATVLNMQGQARINISNASLLEAVNGTKTCCDVAVALTTGCNLFSNFISGFISKF